MNRQLKESLAQTTKRRHMGKREWLSVLIVVSALLIVPEFAHASLESSLDTIRSRLTGVIMPVLSVIGICIAGISFFSGNENAKRHIAFAVIGCLIGFGAQVIVDFFASLVH
jgi:type IV secretory pathway VirB2 component (pilin)